MKKGDKLPSSIARYKSEYMKIINYYGTHITQSVTFGGRFISLYEITRKQYENVRLEEAGFETKATASIRGVNVGMNASFDYLNKKTEKTSSTDFVQRSYITGGNANNYDKWNNNIETAPAAIKFDLIPISDLLDDKFFANDKDIDKKAAILKAVMINYVVNKMIEPVKIDLNNKNFFRSLKPLEYEYVVDIEHIKCTGVDSGESGSANEFFGHIKFTYNGKSKTVWETDEDSPLELINQASMPIRIRDGYKMILAEGKKAAFKVNAHIYEEDNDSWGDGDDDLGSDSATIQLHEIKNEPKIFYLEKFKDGGDKAEIKIKITRKLKVSSY